MGVEYQNQLKGEIPIESRNMNFFPFYEIPNKMMHKLVYDTNWNIVNWNKIVIKEIKLSITKICAQRYRDIVSTNKAYIYVWKLNTNRNWYYLKCKHTYIKTYMSIQKECQ